MAFPYLDYLINCIFSSIYKFLPAAIANMFPVFIKKYNIFGLRKPIDFNKKFIDNKPIFGSHKTIQGFIFGSLAGGITGFLIGMGFKTGFLLGFGALFGDLFGAFIKRRMNFKSGEDAGLIDQLPFAIFAIIFTFHYWRLCEILLILISIPFLHRLTNIIGYKLKLKEVPW